MLLEAEIAYNIYYLLKVTLKGKAPKILQQFRVEMFTSPMGWNIEQQLLSSVYCSGSSGRVTRAVAECKRFEGCCMEIAQIWRGRSEH